MNDSHEITVKTRGSESTEGTSTQFWSRSDSNPAPLVCHVHTVPLGHGSLYKTDLLPCHSYETQMGIRESIALLVPAQNSSDSLT